VHHPSRCDPPRSISVKTVDVLSREPLLCQLSGDFFDAVSHEMAAMHKNSRPFGGKQLVVCGDFLQV